MRSTFDEAYFSKKRYSAYGRGLKGAVQILFYEILSTVSRFSSVDILRGTGKKALDIGCAFGYGAQLLSILGYDVIGIDVSRHALKKAKHLPPANYILCDACHIPLRRNTFDLITCFEVLEHVTHPLSAIAEASKLLNNQGLSIWTTPVRGQVQKMYDFLRRERTHISILQREKIRCFMSMCFRRTRLLTYLLLPIPPQLLRRYFFIRRTPFPVSSGAIIVCAGPGQPSSPESTELADQLDEEFSRIPQRKVSSA